MFGLFKIEQNPYLSETLVCVSTEKEKLIEYYDNHRDLLYHWANDERLPLFDGMEQARNDMRRACKRFVVIEPINVV